MNSGIRKIPPWSIFPRWIPPDKIPPSLNLTQNLTLTQVGIDHGELTRGGFSGHHEFYISNPQYEL